MFRGLGINLTYQAWLKIIGNLASNDIMLNYVKQRPQLCLQSLNKLMLYADDSAMIPKYGPDLIQRPSGNEIVCRCEARFLISNKAS